MCAKYKGINIQGNHRKIEVLWLVLDVAGAALGAVDGGFQAQSFFELGGALEDS